MWGRALCLWAVCGWGGRSDFLVGGPWVVFCLEGVATGGWGGGGRRFLVVLSWVVRVLFAGLVRGIRTGGLLFVSFYARDWLESWIALVI